MKILKQIGFRLARHLLYVAFGVMVIFSVRIEALALTSGYYTTDTKLKPAMAVSLSESSTATNALVERTHLSRPDKFLGVAVGMEDALLIVASDDSQVYVATSGEVEAYVVDVNGDIAKGDNITISPIRGVLMKASSTSETVIGVALDDFDGSSAEKIDIQDGDQTLQTNLGKLNINIDARVAQTNQPGQSYLERLGRSLSDQEVSELQVLTAFVIFLVLLVVEGAMMYGAIAAVITALGRNPLSKKLIYKAFLRSLSVALIILLIGLGAIYLVLIL